MTILGNTKTSSLCSDRHTASIVPWDTANVQHWTPLAAAHVRIYFHMVVSLQEHGTTAGFYWTGSMPLPLPLPS